MRLHFIEPQDVLDGKGRLRFEASQLQQLGKVQGPAELLAKFRSDPSIVIHPSWTDHWLNQSGVRVSVAYADGKGGFNFYGLRLRLVAEDIIAKPHDYHREWAIYRLHTSDGVTLDDIEEVFAGPPDCPLPGGSWATGYWMCRNHDTGSLHYYMYGHSREPRAFGLFSFSASDGRNFKLVRPDTVVPTNHDNCAVLWDTDTQRFIMQSLTSRPYVDKPIIDNIGQRRRELTVYESTDGTDFTYLHSMSPDSDDAPDIEFYRVTPFRYGNRFVALANLYAASPLRPNVHGPHLRCEWWISDDCIHWRRHWREVDAQGDAPYTAEAEPIYAGGKMQWWLNDQIWGIPEHRVAGVAAQSNGAFTTMPFTMGKSALRLNASLRERPRFFDQDYVMAEILDEWGVTIPGYESEKCLVRNVDAVDIPLRWDGRDATELAGRRIGVRFRFRGAHIYSLDDGVA